MINYDAILFDFDGVLLDSEPVHFECWLEALKPFGIQCDWESYSKYCIGIPDPDAVKFLCSRATPPVDFEAGWARYDQKRELFRARMLGNPPFDPAVLEFIKTLSGYRLAVVTASARGEIEPMLEGGGIRRCFDAVVCREDIARNKPAPDGYLLAANLLGAARPLVVEDSDAGIASGKAAGFDVLRVTGPSELPQAVRGRLSA